MWEHLKDIFYFSRGEKNGIIVLLCILVTLIVFPYVSAIFISNEEKINKEFEEKIAIFKESLVEVNKTDYNNRLNQYIIERYDSIELFHFNPNTASSEDFKKLGLTIKQIRTIRNYIDKGAKFYVRDDFRKIYGIRNKQYQILKPYILLPEKRYANKKHKYSNNYNKIKNTKLFVFDPNTASVSELINLGLSSKQANIVKKYLKNGGKFKTKEDFRKIYSIPVELHEKLEPYILIKDKPKTSESKNIETNDDNELEIIELNTATIDELVKIKGIGTYTAKLIIQYRKKLRGFSNINQLIEIKKLSKSNFKNYKKQLRVNKKLVNKISINFAESNELAAHPYINYYQAKEIVKYRTKHGAYTNIQQLLDNKILLKETYNKVKIYIKLN